VTGRAFLAVDGGNSKTDVALVSDQGHVLGVARGPGLPYRGIGVRAAIERLGATVETCCADAQRNPGSGPVAGTGVYCLPGIDLRANRQTLGRAVAQAGWTERNMLLNDTFAVLRAGSDRGWGVAVVCGAGMNCLGIGPSGRMVRFPALGWASGDGGGGFVVGREAVAASVRGRDGRGPRTVLEQLVPEHFGLPRPGSIAAAIHAGRLSARRVVELPPVVFAAAGAGDHVAREIVDRLADEVIALVLATVRRLRVVREDTDVVLGGGLFRSGDEAFLTRIGEGIAAVAPRARVAPLTAPPVVGAALMALDLLATPAAARRLRTRLDEERLRNALRC
jgi:N-acetylglucosamine kinase-like BadF-type ATPase